MRKVLLFALAAIALLSGCKKDEKVKTDKTGGLLNFTIYFNDQEYKATKTGPYAPDEDVIVMIPSTYEEPTDLSALECYASFANNCYADPIVPSVCDFSRPYPVTVINADGISQTNNIVVKYSYPKIHVEQVWEKTCTGLGLTYHFTMNVAADKEYLYITDIQQGTGKTIKVYDRLTGTFVRDLPELPGLCFLEVYVDDAGTLLASTYNLYNAGFKLYAFNSSVEQWQEVIKYAKRDASEGDPGLVVPADLGWKSSLVGDVYGDAYVYATIRGKWDYYEWEIKNGTLTDGSPRIKSVAAPGETVAASGTLLVVRENATESSDMYFSADGGNVKGANSYLKCVTADYDEIGIPVENFGHRAQNLKVFTLGDDKWMVCAGVGSEYSYSGSHLSVFNITDKDKMAMKPGDDGYAFDFRLFKSPGLNGQSTTRTTGLAVWKDEAAKTAWIYYANSSKGLGDEKDLPNSIVRCYKMTYSVSE